MGNNPERWAKLNQVVNWSISDPNCLIFDCFFSNVRTGMIPNAFVFQVLQEEVGLAQLVVMLCTEAFNPHAKLHYLAPLLSNLTQLPEARRFLMDKDRSVVLAKHTRSHRRTHALQIQCMGGRSTCVLT